MNRQKTIALFLLLLFGAVLQGEVSAAPGLDGDSLLDEQGVYPSYAMNRYISYNAMVPSRGAVYDRLGQFVNYGGYGLRWSEVRDRYTQEKVDAGLGVLDLTGRSNILQESRFFNFLAIVRQNYGGEFMSMAVGRNLSTSFSPLILNHMTYGGLRVDYGNPRNDFTFLLSRGGSLESALLFSRMRGDQRGFDELSPVIVTGGNWRGHFGALDLGASFFRQLQSNVKSKPGSLIRGDVPYPEFRSPEMLKVRVTDDSPLDPGKVAVYGAQIFIKGQVDSTDVFYTSSREQGSPKYTYQRGLEASFSEGRRVGDSYEASGQAEQIVIDFDLSGLYASQPGLVVVDAQVELMIEGDYRIGTRQLYGFEMPDGSITSRTWPFTDTGQISLDQFTDYRDQDEMYYTVLRAEDIPAAGDGPKVVRFRHGIPTAQTFYGLNANLLTKRFHLSGEFVLNPQDFKFPTEKGKHRRKTAKAGFLTLLGKMGNKGNIGAEIFRIEPTYGGWYDSQRGGLVLHTDVRESAGGVENATGAMTQEFRVYDDNDDHDNWPDDYPGSSDLLYMAKGAFDRPTYPSSRPEGGVYPGLDMNGDLILDYDRNRNSVEDYLEPFYGYDVDPPEFVYGIDLNNNLVPDFRENDDEPDYPYRRDQQGTHLFYDLTRRPWWLSTMRIGRYRSEEIAGGREMKVLYARMGLRSESAKFWLSFDEDIKRVRDDIPDDVYRVVTVFDPRGTGTRDAVAINQKYNEPRHPPPPDFLPMRNSLVNTVNLDSRWMPGGEVQIANSFKYVLNRKYDDEDGDGSPLQEEDTLHNFSMVNKASYTRQILPKLIVTARLKHLLAKWGEGSYVPVDTFKTFVYEEEVEAEDGTSRVDTVAALEGEASWSLVMPELIVSYALTPRTRIEFGQHGLFLPFLQGRYIDREIPANSYEQRVSLLQLSMEGAYGGYRMVSSVGLKWENVELNKRALGEDVDFTSFFVDVIFSPE